MSAPSERNLDMVADWLDRAQDYANTGRKRREELREEMVSALAAARAEGVAQGRREANAPTWRVVTRAEYKALPLREKWHVPADHDALRVVLWNYQTGEPVAVLDIPTLRRSAMPAGKIKHKAALFAAVAARDGMFCHWCGCVVRLVPSFYAKPLDRDHATLDHLTPRSQGGADVAENLVMACFGCNQTRDERR